MDFGRIATGVATGGLSEVGGYLGGAGDPLGLNRLNRAEELYGGVDPTGQYERAAGNAERFGQRGAFSYGQLGREADAQRGYLGKLARGEESISAEQLRQGLRQQVGQQVGLAAGATPTNSLAAARQASMNAMRAGTALSGQQAIAGIAERQAANQSLSNAILQQRQQDLNATLGGQQNALTGYGGIEQNRTARYGAAAGAPTAGEQVLGAGAAAASLFAKSDRRLKTDITDGEEEAVSALRALKAVSYRYKDERHGRGRYTGIMAQDLEKTPAGRSAVVDEPDGKAVNGARLASILAAAMPAIERRVSKLERRKRSKRAA